MASRVVYTYPAWALAEAADPAVAEVAALERAVLGPDVALELGCRDGAGFVTGGDQLLDLVRGADAIVVNRVRVTPEMVEVIRPTCRVVARQGVGFDNVAPELLDAAGIYAFNVPDYCVDEVSTHTLALLLALERGVCFQDRAVKAGQWDPFGGGRPRRMCGRTIGIVGFGRIGRATARKAAPFYDRVLVHDPFLSPDLILGMGAQPRPSLGALVADSDAVVLHTPLDPNTYHLVDAEVLAQMRSDALLVNTARGLLVDTAAVLDALRAGAIGGFASDVFTPEDPNADPVNRQLLELPNVVVSSHRAFLSEEAEQSQRRRVAEGLAHVLSTGEPPIFGRLA